MENPACRYFGIPRCRAETSNAFAECETESGGYAGIV
jgi:hypothetical protein